MKYLILLFIGLIGIIGYSQVGAEELPQKGTIIGGAEDFLVADDWSFDTLSDYEEMLVAETESLYNATLEFSLYTPTIHICPIHGEVDSWTVFNFVFENGSDLNGKYCMKCIAKWAKDNFNQVKPK